MMGYQCFISYVTLISSPITCCENRKVAFFLSKCDKNILSVILASYHPLISKKLIISRCAEVRTFSRRGKPSARHYTLDSKFSAPHGDAIDFRYQISDFVVTLCWSPTDAENEPWCFYSKNLGYTSQNVKFDNSEGTAIATGPVHWPGQIRKIKWKTFDCADDIYRVKILDPNDARYEVPSSIDCEQTEIRGFRTVFENYSGLAQKKILKPIRPASKIYSFQTLI